MPNNQNLKAILLIAWIAFIIILITSHFVAIFTVNGDEQGLWYEYVNQEKEYKTEFYEGAAFTVIVPSEHKQKPVVGIGTHTFGAEHRARFIFLPDTVTYIEEYAFSGSSLVYIDMPDCISFIGDKAFCACKRMRKIKLPSKITAIQASTFQYCSKLREVVIPNEVQYIGDYAFDQCSSLKEINLPSNVYYIGAFAFHKCATLKEIALPSELDHIGESAFEGCSLLKQITFEGTVSQWEQVSLGKNWNRGVPADKVICSDGVFPLN